jgi:hypothetical protein
LLRGSTPERIVATPGLAKHAFEPVSKSLA